jgi:hypothetical protein
VSPTEKQAAPAIAADSPPILSSAAYRQMAVIVASMILDTRKEVLA